MHIGCFEGERRIIVIQKVPSARLGSCDTNDRSWPICIATPQRKYTSRDDDAFRTRPSAQDRREPVAGYGAAAPGRR
jgi:hypothetical protein